MTLSLAILCVPGHGVSEAHKSGIESIHAELYHQHAGPHSLVRLLEWDYDWKDVARIIDRDLDGTLIYVGHSYGAGVAFPNLAKRLNSQIDLACLIDPVPRAIRWFGIPTLLHVLGVTRDLIKLPLNVRCALTWRQTNNRPTGRAVQGSDAQLVEGTVYRGRWSWTLEHEIPIVDGHVRHDTIDGLPAVRTRVVERVGSLVDARMGR